MKWFDSGGSTREVSGQLEEIERRTDRGCRMAEMPPNAHRARYLPRSRPFCEVSMASVLTVSFEPSEKHCSGDGEPNSREERQIAALNMQ